MGRVLALPDGRVIAYPEPKQPYPDLYAVLDLLRSDIWLRWMRKAQKLALEEWQMRKKWPGLQARFRRENTQEMGLGDPLRFKGSGASRRNNHPFFRTGSLFKRVMWAKPKAKTTSKTKAKTVLSYGGGALNFLRNVRPVVGRAAQQVSSVVQVPGHQVAAHTRRTGGRSVGVDAHQRNAYAMTRTYTKYVPTYAPKSYAEAYEGGPEDNEFIAERTEFYFMEIVRKAALTKTGKLKVSFVSKLAQEGESSAGGFALPRAA